MPIATELSVLDGALKCGERGLYVFSLYGIVDGNCACGDAHEKAQGSKGKHPRKMAAAKEATTIASLIKLMFGHDPSLNYGIVTGLEIGSTGKALVVIDVDSYKAGADDHLAELIRKHGKLPVRIPVIVTADSGPS